MIAEEDFRLQEGVEAASSEQDGVVSMQI